jgi:hypothetical protein
MRRRDERQSRRAKHLERRRLVRPAHVLVDAEQVRRTFTFLGKQVNRRFRRPSRVADLGSRSLVVGDEWTGVEDFQGVLELADCGRSRVTSSTVKSRILCSRGRSRHRYLVPGEATHRFCEGGLKR